MRPLPEETVHLSFDPGPFRMAMGLIAREPDALIELDACYPAELAERRALLDGNRAAVFAALPESDAARAEVLALLGELLPRRFSDWFARDGVTISPAKHGIWPSRRAIRWKWPGGWCRRICACCSPAPRGRC